MLHLKRHSQTPTLIIIRHPTIGQRLPFGSPDFDLARIAVSAFENEIHTLIFAKVGGVSELGGRTALGASGQIFSDVIVLQVLTHIYPGTIQSGGKQKAHNSGAL
jgi:hypothetical protein